MEKQTGGGRPNKMNLDRLLDTVGELGLKELEYVEKVIRFRWKVLKRGGGL